MVADQSVSRLHAEPFLGRANGRTFEAIQRLLHGSGKSVPISSSLLSNSEAGALGLPPSVIPSVQDLARPLVDVLSRGGKGWRGYALAICCEMVGGDFDPLQDWLAFSEILHAGATHMRLLHSLAGSGVLELCRTRARDAVRSELRALERTFPQAKLPTLEQFATLVIEDYY